MEELMTKGWRFEFFQNQLDTFSCVAKKGEHEIIICDNFHWWALITDIVAKCDEYGRNEE